MDLNLADPKPQIGEGVQENDSLIRVISDEVVIGFIDISGLTVDQAIKIGVAIKQVIDENKI